MAAASDAGTRRSSLHPTTVSAEACRLRGEQVVFLFPAVSCGTNPGCEISSVLMIFIENIYLAFKNGPVRPVVP